MEPDLFMPVFWFLVIGVGACVGSFLNVCIHRLPRELSIVRPRSFCPACSGPVAWYDNVPILSYVLLRGRCRSCAARIAARYPLVEASTVVLFALLFSLLGPSAAFVIEAALGASLIALILIDAGHQILPDAITLPGIVAGLLAALLGGSAWSWFAGAWITPFWDACAGAVLGYALPWMVNASYRGWQAARGVPGEERIDGIGQGDFKLLAMIGAFMGVRVLLFVLFFGAISGAAFGLYMMRFGGYGWKSKLPYGVFLGGAAILALFVGRPWIGWYLRAAGIAP